MANVGRRTVSIVVVSIVALIGGGAGTGDFCGGNGGTDAFIGGSLVTSGCETVSQIP